MEHPDHEHERGEAELPASVIALVVAVTLAGMFMLARIHPDATYRGATPRAAANPHEIVCPQEPSPQFPGGIEALFKFLERELKYPEAARKAGIEGRVFVQFVIGKNGKIRDVSVMRGLGAGCDEEAVRVVKAMPDWIPAQWDGKPVWVRVSMPITFKAADRARQLRP